jgi:hypothetical protein
MTTSLLRDVLGCPGSVSGPPNLAEPVRLVLAEIASSWRNRLAGSGTPAAHHLAFHVLASGHISDQASGVCRRTRAGYSVDITLSASIPVPRLRHCLSHELGHVLVNQCVVQGSPDGGLASEYAAERIGWEIALAAGLRPHVDVFAGAEREDQRAWLRPLVAIVGRLRAASPEESGHLDDGPYGRDLRWLFKAAGNMARAEAYRRGQADAGVTVEEPRLPDSLDTALETLCAPITEHPLPPLADASDLREFLEATAGPLNERLADLALHVLRDLAVTNADDFIAAAPARAA